MSRRINALALTLATLVAAGCNSSRTVEGAETSQGVSGPCTRCHGDATRAAANELERAAPPRDTHASSDRTAIGVGAHQAHLTGAHLIGAPVACESCHIVPATADDPSHKDGVKVVFGAAARLANVSPVWNRSSATCTVYCHGASLTGGSARAPVWTKVDGAQVSCGSCHGYPPPRPHPQRTDCRSCHPATVGADGKIDLASGKHLDGQVEVDYAAMGCADCHGDPDRAASALDRAAPPVGTHGETATTDAAVGAHQAHLTAGHVAKPIACAECHVVPSSPSHPNHVVDLAFGTVARADGASTVWNASSATCSVYCHGATLSGGVDRVPVWTKVDGAQRQCDSCHGYPPPAPHPASTQCSACHPGTVEADNVTINVANGLHVNGAADASRYHPSGWIVPTSHGYAANANLASCKTCHGGDLAGGSIGISCSSCHGEGWQSNCTFCHGTAQRATNKAAPPVGTQGEIAASAPPVGAHQQHLQDGSIRRAVECSECHAVPTDLSHVTGRPATLTFGALATKDDATPQYTPADHTCSGTYCHGAKLQGGEHQTPVWTVVDGSQKTCKSCHGAPPPPPHPAVSTDVKTCVGCHAATVASDGTIVPDGKHLDGIPDFSGHAAGFGSDPASSGFHAFAANADLASCTRCHGAALEGNGVVPACASCHKSGGSGAPWGCTMCHGGTDSQTGAPPKATWGNDSPADQTNVRIGAHTKHLTTTIAPAIGCGACHVTPADALAAGHVDGPTATVTFSGTAAKGPTQPSWDRTAATCSTYCHGSARPRWTGGASQGACGTCHGIPPTSGHAGVSSDPKACNTCHATTVAADGTIIAGGTHLDGTVQGGHGASWMDPGSPSFHAFAANDGLGACVGCHGATLQGIGSAVACASCHDGTNGVAPWGCTMCHGGTDNQTGAPPKATWGNGSDAVRVGAHSKHVAGAKAFECAVCHPVVADEFSAGHIDAKKAATVAFSGLATKDVTTQPSWNRASPTCANTYCHGTTLSGGVNQAPLWTGGAGQATCGSCHGAPPTALPHPASSSDPKSCAACHPGTVAADGSIIPASSGGQHVDGIIQHASGHEASWMDPASTNFHAYSANAGLAPCQACHGPTLAGTSTVKGCASCHDGTTAAAWNNCTMCHGGAQNQTGAPPKATWAHKTPADSTNVSIGAHTVHVTGSAIAGPIACGECHIRPADPFAATHIDGPTASVVFGTLATKDASPATWDRTTATCSSTYCHGAKLQGGEHQAPVWTTVDGSQMTCTSCHGAPPAAPHPAVSSDVKTCFECHADTVNSEGTIVSGGKHVDGITDFAGHTAAFKSDQTSPEFHAFAADANLATCTRCHGTTLQGNGAVPACTTCHQSGGTGAPWGCTMCHGTSGGSSAPPRATWGQNSPTDQTNVRIGAHTMHLTTAMAKPFGCEVCHVTPADALATGHVDGPTATVMFGGIAVQGTTGATWNRNGATCSSTYCHGSAQPVWTGGASEAACGSCHALPPQNGKHPAVSPTLTECAQCHPTTVDALGHIKPGGTHLDGNVQGGHDASWMDPASPGFHAFSANDGVAGCATCHGAALEGNGSVPSCASCHDGARAAAWGCTTCHGGTDNQTGAPPKATWKNDSDAVRVGAHSKHVAGAYAFGCAVCHPAFADLLALDHIGAKKSAGVAFSGLAVQSVTTTPTWDRASPTCANTYCHGTTLSGGVNKAPLWTGGAGQATCGSCHGAPPTAAPHPVVSTDLKTCAGCHAGTIAADGTIKPGGQHVDGTIQHDRGHETSWMDPTSNNFHAISANAGLSSCQTCHGPTLAGTSTVRGCASCHTSGGTGAPWGCTMCHGGTDNTSGAPPKATWGNASDAARIGAHTVHLTGSAIAGPIACGECHLVPGDVFAGTHIDGTNATVTFGTLATTGGGLSASWDRTTATCSSTYCHGAFPNGNPTNAPDWTQGPSQGTCGTCHGLPPGGAHPAVSGDLQNCSGCHADTMTSGGAIIPSSQGGKHLDGAVETNGHGTGWMTPASPGFHAVSANANLSTCTGCHGPALEGNGTIPACTTCHKSGGTGAPWGCTMCHGGTNDQTGAPPKATWGNTLPADTTNVRIGAHQAHLASAIAPAFDCVACHVKPADALSPEHVDAGTAKVTFGGIWGKGSGAWDRASASCSNVYCHGAFQNGRATNRPVWNQVGQNQGACGTCHGTPPGGTHPAVSSDLTTCANCHGETIRATGTLIPPSEGGKHLDGAVQGGHSTSWMDQSSPGFHAYSANEGLAGCATCHGQTLDGEGSTPGCGSCHDQNPSHPLPPGVTSWKQDCTMCHGGSDNLTGAPPRTTWGNSADTVRIGAHTSHVQATHGLSAPLDCSTCHTKPADALAAGHVDAVVASVTGYTGADANLRAAASGSPGWNRATASCSTSYCHSGTLPPGTTTIPGGVFDLGGSPALDGGSLTTPTWTTVDGSQGACGTCHKTVYPFARHRQHTGAGCTWCHFDVANDAGTAITNPAAHVNGVVNVRDRVNDPECGGCHDW